MREGEHTWGALVVYDEIGDTIVVRSVRMAGEFADVTEMLKKDGRYLRLMARFVKRMRAKLEGVEIMLPGGST